jgi:NAD(P)-dependent dehydrogenase (short-subunit alcohol dehydrogenase family)
MPADRLDGRVCVVTGANSGIGLETAAGLARLGARVCLVCRSPERGAGAKAEILRRVPDAVLDLQPADLSTQDSVRALAVRLREAYPAIHVLVNNAGVILRDRQSTVDGVEVQFAVNYLAPFLLTTLLGDRVAAGAPARVINLTSGVHGMGKLNTEDLADPARYNAFRAYASSKLAVVAFTRELAEQWNARGVTVNCVEPGLTRTGLMDNARVGMFRMVGAFLRFAPTPDVSAAAIVTLASDPALADTSGRYYRKDKESKAAGVTADPAARRRLWELSERLTAPSDSATRSGA